MDKVVNRLFQQPPRNTGEMNVEKFDKRLQLDEWSVEGHRVVTANMTAKKEDSPDRHVIMLHGGAYTVEASYSHRKIMETLAIDCRLKVSFIDYPLAPENTAKTTLRIVLQAYQEICRRNEGDQFYLFGDSAGGGLALALLQMLRDQGIKPFPEKTALVSPWVDVTMSSKRVKEAKRLDPILPVQGLIEAGKKYAGDMDPRDPLISPLFGKLENLGQILLLVGTHEVLLPDCELLDRVLSNAEGSSVEFHIADRMVHDWVAMPIKEARETILQIGRYYTH